MREYIIGFFCLFLCLLVAFGSYMRSHKSQKRLEQVIHLRDGRYVYKETFRHRRSGAEMSGSDWILWYYLMNTNTGTYYSSMTRDNSVFRPPSGYTWVPAGSKIERGGKAFSTAEPPSPDELSQPLDDATEEVVENKYGDPEIDGDGNLVDPDDIASTASSGGTADSSVSAEDEAESSTSSESTSSSDSSSSSGSSDSSSSSSGDGGSGGGDGGGGD